jgi:hypothetical protein
MDEQSLELIPEANASKSMTRRIDGVVIGILVGLDDSAKPLVAFPGNPQETGMVARSTTVLSRDDIGREIALLFEGGDPNQPLIIGRIQHPEEIIQEQEKKSPVAELDAERIVLSAGKEIVLKCGKASITLTRAGKILLRGAYLLSRSSGVNRIKGGSVQIN